MRGRSEAGNSVVAALLMLLILGGVYLLLRREYDRTDLDEVFVVEPEDYGLPPLAEEASATAAQTGESS